MSSKYIDNQKVERIFGYPNSNSKNFIKTKQRYGLTELRLDSENQLLFVHNSTLHQVDIIDLSDYSKVKTLKYHSLCPSLKAHKGIDLCSEKQWLMIGGNQAWLVWDYKNEAIVAKKEFDSGSSIIAAQLSPDKQELWVTFQDQYIQIYNTESWEASDKIEIRGTYSPPLVWHPNGQDFLFTYMEQGGSSVFIGNIKNRTIDWSRSANSTSYILANICFDSSGEFLLYTDAGLQVCKFPSLEHSYSLNQYTPKFTLWESPQYPSSYLIISPIYWDGYTKYMLLVTPGGVMTVQKISDNQGGFYFSPLELEGYNTIIEGIISAKEKGIFYFSDYLGGIFRLDIKEAIEELL